MKRIGEQITEISLLHRQGACWARPSSGFKGGAVALLLTAWMHLKNGENFAQKCIINA